MTLSEAERSEEVLEYWRQLVCLQGVGGVDIKPETFFLSLRNAAKANLWEEVETIIGMMQVCVASTYGFCRAVMGQGGRKKLSWESSAWCCWQVSLSFVDRRDGKGSRQCAVCCLRIIYTGVAMRDIFRLCRHRAAWKYARWCVCRVRIRRRWCSEALVLLAIALIIAAYAAAGWLLC